MIQFKNLLLGAIGFVVVHLVLVATWQTWFEGGGGHAAWFMNSSRSVAFTAAIFAALSLLAVVTTSDKRGEAVLFSTLNIAVGATVPMAITLFTLPTGPGNLFPIAIVIGFFVFVVSGAVGALIGWALRSALARTTASR